jgi:hypothetical protein
MPQFKDPPSLELATKFENEVSVQVSQNKPGGPATLVVQGPLRAVLSGLDVFMKQAAGARPRSAVRRRKPTSGPLPR